MEEKEFNNTEKKAEDTADKVNETEKVSADEEVCEANKKIYDLEQKCAETNDKYLRIMAEYDNFRKRTVKERDGIYQEAYSEALKQLLPIIDNIERASAYSEDKKLSEGIGMIMSSISEILKKIGVTETETKIFDPKLHNAVMHIEDENFGEGEIVEVFQKGYVLGEKVIRHAMVKVAN